MSAPSIAWLRDRGVAVFEDADRCMLALHARAVAGGPPPGPALPVPAAPILLPERPLESESMAALGEAGVPVPITVLCPTSEMAAETAEQLNPPFAVKAAARDLLHRSDVGGVVLGVRSPEQVAGAHRRVVAAALEAGATPEGSIVQEMAPAGIELICGARRDPEFGPVLVVGLGGITAELEQDVARRMLPLHEGEAEAMLRELRAFPLLQGYRGRPPADLGAAVRAVEALAGFAVSLGETLEAVEINPLIVHPGGAVAVDALIVRAAESRAARSPIDAAPR